jgi:hypothetical protein
MTTTKPKLERSTAVMALKQRNEQNFRNLGLLTPNFTIKFAYVPKHREDMVVSMFPSEMECGEDIYMELTDGNNYPLHEQAVLYKLRHNPYYKQGEYEVIPPDPSRNKNAETYLVPISELEVVSDKPAAIQIEKPVATAPAKKPMISTSIISEDSGFQKEKEDAHYSELTIRDLAAILLKSPVSNKKWLNNLINTNK